MRSCVLCEGSLVVCYNMYRLYKPCVPMSKVTLVVLITYVVSVRDQASGVLGCGMMSI